MWPESYDALGICGGRAHEYLRFNEKLLRVVRHSAAQRLRRSLNAYSLEPSQ
jgi:hypothetical protein